MTVQDALERAKQMAKARETRAIPARLPVPPPVQHASRPEPVSAVAVPLQAYAPNEERRSPLPNFTVRPYDAVVCTENRVLVPGARSADAAHGAAAYRILRARLLQKVRSDNWTAVGLTSPGPSEGKSLTAINLALTIAAERNNDVFLLDLDLRNPSIARYLGVTPPREIASYLGGNSPAEEVLFSIGIEHLTLAANGRGDEHASELLATGRIYELLTYIRNVSTRPLVIVDMPPILNTDDALVVAPQLDGMLLVVGEGRTRRDGLERAAELLADFNLAGIVLNHSRESLQEYYSGSYGSA